VMLTVTLLYANRSNDIAFKSELDRHAAANPALIIHYLVDPERITAESITKYVPDLSKPVFYISGPKPMVESVAHTLGELGVSENRIKLDDFPGYAE